MTRAARFILLAAFFAVVSFAGSVLGNRVDASDGEPGALYRAGNIAVVNIEDITNDWLRRTGSAEDIEQKYLGARRTVEQIRSMIESMEQESQIYDPTEKKYVELRAQIAVKSAEMKVRGEAARANRDLGQAQLMNQAYKKAMKVIEAIAKERGLDLVMLRQTGELSSKMVLQEITSNILVRSVVFARDAIDITEDVKDRMQ